MSSETLKQEEGVMGSMMKKVGDTFECAKEAVVGKPAQEKTAAEKATEAKDHAVEKAAEAKDFTVDKGVEAKDFTVVKATDTKDFVGEKTIEGKDIAGTKMGEATEHAQDAGQKGRDMFPGNNEQPK